MDSAQAKLFAESLENAVVGGWTVEGVYGSGKSAVVFRASKDGVTHHNANSQPFRWTATADSILEKLHRLCSRISGTGH